MVVTGIIKLVEQLDWVSPMVVQEKKTKGEIIICVDLHKLNDACVHDPFPTAFSDEILDSVGSRSLTGFRATIRLGSNLKITAKLHLPLNGDPSNVMSCHFGSRMPLLSFQGQWSQCSKNSFTIFWRCISMTGLSSAWLNNTFRTCT